MQISSSSSFLARTLTLVISLTVTREVIAGRYNPHSSYINPSSPHGRDNSVCQDISVTQGPYVKKINLPDSYTVRVEANILNKNMTVTAHEYFNKDANIAATRTEEDGDDRYYFYLFNTNELLEVFPDSRGGYLCSSMPLSGDPNQDFYGMTPFNSTRDTVFSVYGALHFTNGISEVYLGQETVRGIPCYKFHSCQYMTHMDATSNVTWYFSDDSQWSSISGFTAPVRAVVNGVRYMNDSSHHPFSHIYEFYDFQGDVNSEDDHFEVPLNTMCFSRTNTKPLPKMPQTYTFNTEILNVLTNSISFYGEGYDNETQMVQYAYRQPASAGSAFGTRLVHRLADFNTGVRYTMDVFRGTCVAEPIPKDSFDDSDIDPTHVRFRKPNEFLELNYKYVYQGVRHVRGIECDYWTAMRFDYPESSDINPATTWTWYFATSQWLTMMGFQADDVLPVMLEVFCDDEKLPIDKQMSFYEYNAQAPNEMYDISACYNTSTSRNYAFFITAQYSNAVQNQLRFFKRYIRFNLMSQLSISPLRIANLDVQSADGNTLVTFDLLDKAPVTGDVLNAKQEPSLDSVYQNLDSLVNSGKLTITVTSSQFSNVVVYHTMAAPDQYKVQSTSRKRREASPSASRSKRDISRPNPPPSSSGYTGGAMGGMAVGMLILGVLVGFGATYLVYRLKGGTFNSAIPMERMNN